jgi:hypothetical protein
MADFTFSHQSDQPKLDQVGKQSMGSATSKR